MQNQNVAVKNNSHSRGMLSEIFPSFSLALGGRGWHKVPGEGVIHTRHCRMLNKVSSPSVSIGDLHLFTLSLRERMGVAQVRGKDNKANLIYTPSWGRGFTLIELLVVVLIIGILAAVAVPQYQKAVIKSRAATILPLLSTIRQAQETYFLANGDFALSFEDLDMDIPCTHIENTDMAVCGNDWVIDLLAESLIPSSSAYKVGAYFCPGKAAEDPQSCEQGIGRELYYNAWYHNGWEANTITCHGQTDLGKSICQGSMTTL